MYRNGREALDFFAVDAYACDTLIE